MSKTSKAVVFRENNQPVSVETVTIASPKRDQVMVKLSACGICHSDLSVINQTIPLPPPIVLGHEAAGVVVEVGEGVSELQVGDHVVVSWSPNCGKCNFCGKGRPELCDLAANSQATLRDGTTPVIDEKGNPVAVFIGIGVMAEYATMHKDNAIKIDKEIPLEIAALVGCAVMTGVGAVINTANIEVGSKVAVFGAGGIGLSAIQGAAMSGALQIIAVDVSDEHLDMAKKFGATHFVNPKNGDPVMKIQEITNAGADYAFECIGLPLTIGQAYECLNKGGTAVIVGVTKMTDAVTIPSFMIPLTERILKGSNYGSAKPAIDFPKLLALYKRGLLKLDELVTARYKIEDAQQAFDDLQAGKNARGIIVF